MVGRSSRVGPSRPTLHSVAAAAGVSHQTVSNVLNAPERVRPDTRARVLEVIRAVDYRPHETARSLVHRRTRLVSFHVGHEAGDDQAMLNDFARALARAGRTLGYRVVFDVVDGDDADQITSFEDLLARRAVDGVVVPATHVGDPRPAWLTEHGMPMVAFGRPWHDRDATHAWVDVDGRHGTRLATEHLLAAGHRRIAYVGPPPDGGMEDDRRAGVAEAVAAAVGDLDADLALFVPTPAHLGAALPGFLAAHEVTALVCRDDEFAAAAQQVARGVARPVAVTGFDDSPLAGRCLPALTSVAQPVDEVAALIWSSLVDQVEGRRRAPLQRLIRPRLVPRESSASPSRPA